MENFDLHNYDYTRTSDFMICHRRGYFAHVRHWQPDTYGPPLVFGISWHAALEAVYRLLGEGKATTDDLLTTGGRAFVESWSEYNLSPTDHHPRSVEHGLYLLDAYVQHYKAELERVEVIAVERPFKVALHVDDLYYHGRIDLVARLPQLEGVYVLDHKTTSSFSTTWTSTFSPDAQIDGYCHAGHMLYGDVVRGVLINGALVQKTRRSAHELFVRVPVLRNFEHLDAWAWELADQMEDIKHHWLQLVDFRSDPTYKRARFMPAFPKRTTSCSAYGGCRYLDLCKATSNPESWDEPPVGFVVRPWDYTKS